MQQPDLGLLVALDALRSESSATAAANRSASATSRNARPDSPYGRPSDLADIAVPELRDGNFDLTDSEGSTITAKRRLIAQMTLRGGRVCYERPAEQVRTHQAGRMK